MKVFASSSRIYRLSLLILLSILVIVFVVVARWRMAQYDRDALPRPGTRVMRILPPPEPSARVASGVSIQGPFTLLAVTRTGPLSGTALPPAIKSAMMQNSLIPSGQNVEGSGLWIDVRGGIGLLTRTVPVDGSRHLIPFGPKAAYAVTLTPSGPPPVRLTFWMLAAHYLLGRPLPPISHGGGWTGTTGWYDGTGRTPLADGLQPFTAQLSADPGVKTATILFIPRRMSTLFAVMAQPLAASGAPSGGPVALEAQPVSRRLLFLQFPAAYSEHTRQMEITMTRTSHPTDRASWRLADLPSAHSNGPDVRPARTGASYGSLSIQAAAIESEDLSGSPAGGRQHPARDAGGGWTWNAPRNIDGHSWTGVPTLRCLVRLRNSAPPAARQEWTVITKKVTPQWTPPPSPAASGASLVPQSGLSTDRVYSFTNDPLGGRWQGRDWQVGIAYPGQQHWLQIDGVAVRSGYRYETVTLRDADIAYDPAAGHWRVFWQRAQTVTTPSGISVTTINALPGSAGGGVPRGAGVGLWFPVGGERAEMFLAWRLPAGLTNAASTNDALSRHAYPPGAFGPFVSDYDYSGPPMSWQNLWVPGAPIPAPVRTVTGRMAPPPVTSTILGPLIHGGWQPLHYGLRLASTPPTQNFPQASSGYLLPRHLDALSFRVYLQAPVERHPFSLVLPIAKQFPSGWDPDQADGKSRVIY